MPDSCPQLQRANESRRRAWRELQVIRKMLALVIEDLPPPPKPASFQKEGEILRAALFKAIHEPWQFLADLEKAVEKIRPCIGKNFEDNNSWAGVLLELNRAMNQPRLTMESLRKLRQLVKRPS